MKEDVLNLAAHIDHTLLKAEARRMDLDKLCEEAVQFGFYSVCVNSGWVSYCRDILRGTEVRISAVCGFPLGAQLSEAKAYEASKSVECGASEIDMVLNVGFLLDGNYAGVEEDIRKVVDSVQDQAIVKVILETGYLNDEQKKAACRLAEQAGAQFVKTSTGFGPGGASEEDVKMMRQAVSSAVQVKASGGIRDTDTAIRMLAAGASRLGTSSGVAIISGGKGPSEY